MFGLPSADRTSLLKSHEKLWWSEENEGHATHAVFHMSFCSFFFFNFIFSSFSSSRHTQIQTFQYLHTKGAVQWYNLFPPAISCSGYLPKNFSKYVQKPKFQQAFFQGDKEEKGKRSLLKPKFLQFYIVETLRPLFSIPA